MSGLFVYGTMLHRPLLERLVGDLDGAEAVDAVLPGYRVVRDEKDHMPVLAADAEGSARGTLWTGLPEEARALLDVYELTRSYRPVPVVVWAEGEAREAWAYAPPPWMPPSGEDWDLEAWLRVDGEMDFLRAEEIAGRPPSGAEMLTQAPMIAHRAAAAVRAREGAPTVLRRRAGPGDATWRKLEPPAGRFFRFERLEVAHLRFDGGRNEGLGREVMVGVDAALVLPYDRARDRVLLVEQVRTGPLRRGDGQPWILEPVAGLVDAHETPEEGARREAREEAALDLQDLVPMFRGYASPGNSTDHFYAFLGMCDLPDGRASFGGLAEEHEDLRLHVLPASEAIALVDTGEANAVPLVAMLLWLDRWRRS